MKFSLIKGESKFNKTNVVNFWESATLLMIAVGRYYYNKNSDTLLYISGKTIKDINKSFVSYDDNFFKKEKAELYKEYKKALKFIKTKEQKINLKKVYGKMRDKYNPWNWEFEFCYTKEDTKLIGKKWKTYRGDINRMKKIPNMVIKFERFGQVSVETIRNISAFVTQWGIVSKTWNTETVTGYDAWHDEKFFNLYNISGVEGHVQTIYIDGVLEGYSTLEKLREGYHSGVEGKTLHNFNGLDRYLHYNDFVYLLGTENLEKVYINTGNSIRKTSGIHKFKKSLLNYKILYTYYVDYKGDHNAIEKTKEKFEQKLIVTRNLTSLF